MIAHLRGKVAGRSPGAVVIDVNGVGYLVHVATNSIPPRGEPVELYTSLQVREDSMTLYGFPDRGSLELFELLLSSSGVGPKLGLAALGTLRPDAIRQAIVSEDTALLTSVPGIGKKVAQRLVLELRDKVGGLTGGELIAAAAGISASGEMTPLGEARAALVALGYTPGEIQPVLADLDADASAGELLRLALRELGSHATSGSRSGGRSGSRA